MPTAAEKAAAAAAKAAETTAADTTTPATELSAEEVAERELTAETKSLLKRYGLKRAIVEIKTQNVVFDADLIERLLEKSADEYTIISA